MGLIRVAGLALLFFGSANAAVNTSCLAGINSTATWYTMLSSSGLTLNSLGQSASCDRHPALQLCVAQTATATITQGLCVPSQCSPADLQHIWSQLNHAWPNTEAAITAMCGDIGGQLCASGVEEAFKAAAAVPGLQLQFTCGSSTPDWDTGGSVMLSVLILMLALPVSSEVITWWQATRTIHEPQDEPLTLPLVDNDAQEVPTAPMSVLQVFSLRKNSAALFQVKLPL